MIPVLLISKSRRLIDKTISKLHKDMSVPADNVLCLEKDGTGLRIESLKSVRLFTDRAFNGIRSVVIYDFETARAEVQNALLKTLEEDSDKVLFILVSHSESGLLPTIFSRVKILKPKEEVKTTAKYNDLDLLAFFSKTDKITKEKALDIIDALIKNQRSHLKETMLKNNRKQAIITIAKLRESVNTRLLLQYNNLNSQMAIDHVLLLNI